MLCTFLAITACTSLNESKNDEEINVQVSGTSNALSLDEQLLNRTTILNSKSGLQNLAVLAMSVSDPISTAKASLNEQISRRKSLRWERLPSIEPSATLATTNGKPSARLTVKQTLWDGGRFKGRDAQAQARINIAKIEYWQERNNIVFAALEQYSEILRFKRLAKVSARALTDHSELKNTVLERLAGGVSESSELDLVELRIQELQTLSSTDVSALQTGHSLLQSLIRADTLVFEKDNLKGALQSLNIIDTELIAPSVILTQKSYSLSQGELAEVKSNALPHLVVEGYVERANVGLDNGVGVTLDSDTFSGFAQRANLEAAQAREESSRISVIKARDDHTREVQRLDIEFAELKTREHLLTKQLSHTQGTVKLFPAQFEAGQKPVTDALSLFQSATDAERQLVNVQTDLLQNRIELAQIMGALAPYSQIETQQLNNSRFVLRLQAFCMMA